MDRGGIERRLNNFFEETTPISLRNRLILARKNNTANIPDTELLAIIIDRMRPPRSLTSTTPPEQWSYNPATQIFTAHVAGVDISYSPDQINEVIAAIEASGYLRADLPVKHFSQK